VKRVRSCVGPRVGSVRMDGVHCLSSGVHRGRRKEFLLPFLLSCMLLLSTGTRAGQFGDFTYTSDGTNITITGYTGVGGAVTNMPDMIGGVPVTSIGDTAFEMAESLTSISIPESISRIGRFAFRAYLGLASVTLHSNITNIEYAAFMTCVSLTNIMIPASVTNLSPDVFANCTSLTTVNIPENVTSIEHGAFWGCKDLIHVTIPNSVTSIGNGAFILLSTFWAQSHVDAVSETRIEQQSTMMNKGCKTLVLGSMICSRLIEY
jgi:hypothetical protein